jgi:hypothetical protein
MLLQRHRAIESIGNDAKLTDIETQAAFAALALMDLNGSGASCIANVSRFGAGGLYGVTRPPELPFSACVREHDGHAGRILSGRDNLARDTKSNLSGGVNGHESNELR